MRNDKRSFSWQSVDGMTVGRFEVPYSQPELCMAAGARTSPDTLTLAKLEAECAIEKQQRLRAYQMWLETRPKKEWPE